MSVPLGQQRGGPDLTANGLTHTTGGVPGCGQRLRISEGIQPKLTE